MKYLPLSHIFKAIYQFPKHIIFGVKIVANAPLRFTQPINIIYILISAKINPSHYVMFLNELLSIVRIGTIHLRGLALQFALQNTFHLRRFFLSEIYLL